MYAPNKDSEQIVSYRKIHERLHYSSGTDFVILGEDMNLVQNNKLDKQNGSKQIRNSLQIVKDIILDNSLTDIWRDRNPNTRKFTWSQNNPPLGCRLDYFLIPKHYSDAVQTCSIIPGMLTYHMLIEIKMKINKLVRGLGLDNIIIAYLTIKNMLKK